MKYDMTGGATVIGAMRAIGQLKPPIPVLGVIPCAENLPSGKATKPGDVVRAMTGKTIEVINTDAEGTVDSCRRYRLREEIGRDTESWTWRRSRARFNSLG